MNSYKIPLSLFLLLLMSCQPSYSESKIKTPNVSGQFYEANPQKLSTFLDRVLGQADIQSSDKKIDVLIAPHAGYIYSGSVAAYGYKAASHNKYNTIVILAPSHYVGFDGVSIGQYAGYKTPLGVAEIDESFGAQLIAQDEKFYFHPEAFEKEHSLEVQIPFVQKVFKGAKIVPVIMGPCSFPTVQTFAAALNKTIGGRQDVLVVASTDMSHFHPGPTAKKIDSRTLAALKAMNVDALWAGCQIRSMELCGYIPVVTALLYAKKKGLEKIDVLRYAHSGDVTGDQQRVVGYTAAVIYGNDTPPARKEQVSLLTADQKKKLLGIARRTIEQYLRAGQIYNPDVKDSRLLKEEGAFVTIHKKGQLRGCIGNIIGQGPLFLTVRDMAISSATKDPRFRPVEKDELDAIDIEISVLSKPRQIQNVDEIKMGHHGVIVRRGFFNQGVFLPQVATETGWTKEEFLSQLCSQKAHLPRDCWKDPKTKISIFSAEVFSEKQQKEIARDR